MKMLYNIKLELCICYWIYYTGVVGVVLLLDGRTLMNKSGGGDSYPKKMRDSPASLRSSAVFT